MSEGTDVALQAFETLGRFLEEEGWCPQQAEEDLLLYRVVFAGESGEMVGFAEIEPEFELLIFYVYAPVEAPKERRAAVAEYITRANYGMWIGNLELDYADGEVRYKSSIHFEGTALVEPLIRNVVEDSVQAMEAYLPGLRDVIEGRASPAEAIAAVETDED
jgi:hypothetical protein